MADSIVPKFNITRPQIAAFVKEPRTINDIEAFLRMLREDVPEIIGTKVDETRIVGTDATLTGGGPLTSDLTLGIDISAESERIRDIVGITLTDTATIDFTANDPGDTITADLKNTAVTPGSYGDATHVGTFTVDAQGRLTAAASVAITFPASYTDEQAQDAVGTILTDTATIDFTYNDAGGSITADVKAGSITLAKIANAAANSKLVGSGASGSGASYAELTLGTGLSMSGTTLNVSGGAGGGGGYSYELFGALPLASSFTGVNATHITNTDGSKSMRVSWTASAVNNVEIYKKTAPSTPYDVCLRVRPMLQGTNVQFGIVLRNSSSGKFVILSVTPTPGITVQEWTNATTFSSTLITVSGGSVVPFGNTIPSWLRINNDGTTLTFYWSLDGNLWVSIGTRTLATFLTSCDEYGFGAVCQSISQVFISSLDAALPA